MKAGYREGMSAGKESDAMQVGFDEAFAQVGVPLGREVGNLRGIVSVLLTYLASKHQGKDLPEETSVSSLGTSGAPNSEGNTAAASVTARARAISTALATLSFVDIVPRDLAAEAHAEMHLAEMTTIDRAEKHSHAQRHLNSTDPAQQEIVSERRVKEGIEDILNGLMGSRQTGYGYGGGEERQKERERKQKELVRLQGELKELMKDVGLNLPFFSEDATEETTPTDRS